MGGERKTLNRKRPRTTFAVISEQENHRKEETKEKSPKIRKDNPIGGQKKNHPSPAQGKNNKREGGGEKARDEVRAVRSKGDVGV